MTSRVKDSRRDRELGMQRSLPRRDFLQGMLVGAAATLCAPLRRAYAAEGAAQDALGYYPPRLTGLRGSHPGSFEAAHALRDGEALAAARDTGESYDLIVVGGGISGLAAAHFYRDRYGADSRILILDNHDDFGGHAKRNEFMQGGRMQLMNGGTLDIDSPRPYSAVAEGLIRSVGIDVDALQPTQHRDFYRQHGLSQSVFFDRETFGVDRLVRGRRGAAHAVAHYPLSARARADILRIEGGQIDFMPGLTSEQKKDRLSRMSYADFLLKVVQADPEAVKVYQQMTHGWWGVGIDAISALDCWGNDYSGFKGMHLKPGSIARMGFTPSGFADTGGSKSLHFPDGNASVARLLVGGLLPEAVPARCATDVITARVDYAKLDRASSAVRLRLSSTVVRAANVGAPGAAGTQVTYVRDGGAWAVRGRHCVLASWNMMIPYLCPELPQSQKAALHDLVKTPLVYTSVALRNWQAFAKLKINHVYCPAAYHSEAWLNEKVDIGAYRSSADPAQPMLLHMQRTPCKPGLSEHEQNKAGREELLATPFETFERNVREQLARMLQGGDFDPARDITALTVNRWPHGYAPEYNPLFEPDVPPSERSHVIGRAPFGNITIANSDSGGGAYTDSAIDQAHRAVAELPA
jgi:spermidine dehydrogenase